MAVPITHVAERPNEDDPVVARLTAVYESFRPELVRRCERILGSRAAAEEAAQEAFLRAFEHREQIDLERPLEAWLTTVATRIAVDTVRRRRRVRQDEFDLDAEASASMAGDETFEDVSRRDGKHRLREALSSLPERHRRALVLFGIEGLTYSQIAHAEGMTLGAVKMTLHRARERLRTMVQSNDLFGAVPASATGGTGRGRRALRSFTGRVQDAIGRAANLPAQLGGLAEGITQLAAGAAVAAAGAASLLGAPADPAPAATQDPVPAVAREDAAPEAPAEARAPEAQPPGPSVTDPRTMPPDRDRDRPPNEDPPEVPCEPDDPRPECRPSRCEQGDDCERTACEVPRCMPDPEELVFGEDGPGHLLIGQLPVGMDPEGNPMINPEAAGDVLSAVTIREPPAVADGAVAAVGPPLSSDPPVTLVVAGTDLPATGP